MSRLVSVVIPTYNRAPLLRRAIASVLQQTYRNFELIVVDDASTDEPPEVMQAIKDERVRYLRHEVNRHASAARNTGIRAAQGEYVAFLDDDDEWLPTKLEEQVGLLNGSPPEVGLVYCWMDWVDPDGAVVGEVHPTLRGYVFPFVLDYQRLGGCPTLMVRRSVFETVEGFDEALPRGNDGDFIRRVALHYKVDVVPKVLVKAGAGNYDRISSKSRQGVYKAIEGENAKLRKFGDELSKYPKQTSRIHLKIARHYADLGQWRESWLSTLRAARACFWDPAVYLRSLGVYRKLFFGSKCT